uniref:Small ribosomal subunit protein uS15 N-terminal domain-containing protein n=1 Tax=Rattus norvegicus TaxID=10116 RepID=A0ABK0LCX7_RAT
KCAGRVQCEQTCQETEESWEERHKRQQLTQPGALKPPPSWVACTLPGRACPSRRCPTARSVPTWLKLTSEDVKGQIYKLAKEGLTPSQIGVILRDAHGVAQLRFVTGNKILRILKSKGLAPDLPEDLYHLIKKAVAV